MFLKVCCQCSNTLFETDDEGEGFYLNTVVSKSQSKSWNCKVLVDEKEVTVKVDTSAKVTVLTENIFTQLTSKNYGNRQRICAVQTKGVCQFLVSYQHHSHTKESHVFS